MAVWAAMADPQITVRIALVTAGLAAMTWATATMPNFWSERDVRAMSGHILAGETYKPEVMEVADTYISQHSNLLRPSALEDVAIFRLRQAEVALRSGNVRSADEAIAALSRAVDHALQNSPTASFLWLMRFWTSNRQDGFEPDNLSNLQESYALGPNEAWIAEKRCALALLIFPALPTKLADFAVRDFVGLVHSEQFTTAADIVTGPGAPNRRILLPALGDLSESIRRRFAQILSERNLDDYVVPGIEPASTRPWRH